MAKKNARDNERRAIVEQMRKQQARKERTRSVAILGVCVVIVIGLLTAALVPYLKDRREANRPLADIGVSATTASCSAVTKKDATKSGQHTAPGVKIPYTDAPPAFGKHWENFLSGSEIRSMYTTKDRPPVERLVHSLEHGYTVLWYDDTVKPGTQAYKDLQAMAKRLPVGNRFIAAPWQKADGKSFPSGKHVAMTHWAADPKAQGITQYCGKPSGAVVKKFMKDYTKDNAPEPANANSV